MKNILICMCCAFGFLSTAVAQVQKQDSLKRSIVENEGPLLLKFEPNLDFSANRKRKLFRVQRWSIDSMQISEKKKQRLLKRLHKDIYHRKFDKTVITNTVFEDDIDK